MSTQAIETTDRSFLTTDNLQVGFAALLQTLPAAGAAPSGRQVVAYTDAAWAVLLQGELEEAVDAVLLRATLASTQTLTGRNHRLFS